MQVLLRTILVLLACFVAGLSIPTDSVILGLVVAIVTMLVLADFIHLIATGKELIK